MRTFFRVKWTVRVVNGGPSGISLQIDWPKKAKIYPFLEGVNFCNPAKTVNQKTPKMKILSPTEQAELYRKLLNSGKVKNRAEIARKFGVSRAWVTKVLSSS